MQIGIHQKDIKNIIFIYESKPIIDILKCIKVIIYQNKIRLINLHKNNSIINDIELSNFSNEEYSFLCYIEDLKNLFSVVTEDSMLYIHKIDNLFIYFSNDGSQFKIPIFKDLDFPILDIPSVTTTFKIELPIYSDEIKNILIKSNEKEISQYIAFKVQDKFIYVVHTDDYRMHSVKLQNTFFIPDIEFAIPLYIFEYILKYGLIVYVTDDNLILKNHNTLIVLDKSKIINNFNNAFRSLNQISINKYLNKFTINKRIFLEELKKHAIFSKDILLHVKQNNIILFSNNDKKEDSYIKTVSDCYNLEFNEHQSVLLDVKYLTDFVKSHKDHSFDIYLTDKHFIYSKNNFCATKKII